MKKIALPFTQYGHRLSVALLALFLLIPFQKNFHGFLKSLSRALLPSGLALPPAFSKKLYVSFSDLLITGIALWLLIRFRISLRRFFLEGPAKLLILFLAFAILSLLLSETAHYPLQYLVILKSFLAVLLFNGLRLAIPLGGIADWMRSIAWVLVIAAICESILGTTQYFCQHSLGWKWLGESSIGNFYFPNPSGERWVFDALFSCKTETPFLVRAAGTFGHPNPFGGFFFLSILFTYYLLLREEKISRIRFLQGSLFFQCFTLCTTFSRSAILALALCTALLLIWKKVNRRLVATLIVCTGLCASLFHSQLFARGGLFNYNAVSQGADRERLLYQKVAIAMIQDHPFFGVGFNNFQFQTARYMPEGSKEVLHYQVHNIFLLIAAETGLVGLAIFLLFIAAILRRALHNRDLEGRILLSAYLGILFIGCCDMYPLLHLKFRLYFFAIAALLCVSHRALEDSTTSVKPVTPIST